MGLYARKIGKLVLVPQLGIDEDKQALEQIQNYLSDCKVVGVPDSNEAVSKGGALNCISWNVKTISGNQKFIDEYHKLAQKVVREQQKQPFSYEEALAQTAIINDLSPEEYIKEIKSKNKKRKQ